MKRSSPMLPCFLFALALLSACGPDAAVWVRVEAPFRVPDECDALEVRAIRVEDGEELHRALHPLGTASGQFPIEFALTTDNRANLGEDSVEVEIRAKKGEALAAPWAIGAGRADLVEGEWTQLRIPLCDCSP